MKQHNFLMKLTKSSQNKTQSSWYNSSESIDVIVEELVNEELDEDELLQFLYINT